MDVNIKDYSKIFKCSNLKSRCPEICYNKFKCEKNCKAYSGKCKNKNSAVCRAIRRCKCINIKGKRIGQRCKAQKRLTILSNDRNTQKIRKNKPSNQFCIYKKPKYTKKEEQDYYNAVYKKVYASILTNYLPKRDNRVRPNKKRLREMARQYTVMWLRKYASSQGPTADGWPATSLNGDNRNHFSEVQDGYASNCCFYYKNKNGKLTKQSTLIKNALKKPLSFCRIQNGSCSSVNCKALKTIYRINRNSPNIIK